MDISIIGLGNMGRAFYDLFHGAGHNLYVGCPHQKDIESYQSRDNAEAAARGEIVFLGVKPPIIPAVVAEILPATEDAVLVSMAAGVSLARLSEMAPGRKIIRILPNTPIAVGAGVVAYTPGYAMDAEEAAEFEALLAPAGKVIHTTEDDLDIVSALAGSMPAFVAAMIEAFSDGAVACGMKRNAAYEIARTAVAGSCTLMDKSGLHPGAIKDAVTSPGGTTLEGLLFLESRGMRYTLAEAIRKTVDKNKNLG